MSEKINGRVPFLPPWQQIASLLPPVRSSDANRKCIVIDLDETLVHSSFKVPIFGSFPWPGFFFSFPLSSLFFVWFDYSVSSGTLFSSLILFPLFQPIPNADFIVPVEIDGIIHQVYVLKRPHVDEFLQKVGQMFECVLFTASLAKVWEPYLVRAKVCEPYWVRAKVWEPYLVRAKVWESYLVRAKVWEPYLVRAKVWEPYLVRACFLYGLSLSCQVTRTRMATGSSLAFSLLLMDGFALFYSPFKVGRVSIDLLAFWFE